MRYTNRKIGKQTKEVVTSSGLFIPLCQLPFKICNSKFRTGPGQSFTETNVRVANLAGHVHGKPLAKIRFTTYQGIN